MIIFDRMDYSNRRCPTSTAFELEICASFQVCIKIILQNIQSVSLISFSSHPHPEINPVFLTGQGRGEGVLCSRGQSAGSGVHSGPVSGPSETVLHALGPDDGYLTCSVGGNQRT